jgi:hypothetical protein
MGNKKSITEKPQNEGKLDKDEIPPDSPLGIMLMFWEENPQTAGRKTTKELVNVLHSVRFCLQMLYLGSVPYR